MEHRRYDMEGHPSCLKETDFYYLEDEHRREVRCAWTEPPDPAADAPRPEREPRDRLRGDQIPADPRWWILAALLAVCGLRWAVGSWNGVLEAAGVAVVMAAGGVLVAALGAAAAAVLWLLRFKLVRLACWAGAAYYFVTEYWWVAALSLAGLVLLTLLAPRAGIGTAAAVGKVVFVRAHYRSLPGG